MGGAIYAIRDDGQFVELAETEYNSEALLQELLAKHPNLLAGDQIGQDEPTRWLLISREAGVPFEERGGDRWSLDHLFLDQEAVPTLVEVKRSQDTRIRREVVGQMLDYAANAVVRWPVEEIRAKFESRCELEGLDPGEELAVFIGEDVDPGQFWEKAKTNLQAGKVRLLFVSDEIPGELRRIVEFLNGQMDPAEVLAIEVKQYVGQGLKTLVPRVVGQAGPKPPVSRGRWDKNRFFEVLSAGVSEERVRLAEELLTFGVEVSSNPVQWGAGRDRGSFTAHLSAAGQRFSLFSVYTTGQFSPNFGWNADKLGTRGHALSERYRQLVSDRLSLQFDQRIWERSWPMADLSLLTRDGGKALRDLVTEYVEEVRRLAVQESV